MRAIAIVVGVIVLLVGFTALNGRNSEIERLNERIAGLEADIDHANEDAVLLGDQLSTCQIAISKARKFAKLAVSTHLELLDTAGDWTFEAYQAGLAGTSPEEMNQELGQTIAFYEEQYRSNEAFYVGQFDYLGWAGGEGLTTDNPAKVCLGVEE